MRRLARMLAVCLLAGCAGAPVQMSAPAPQREEALSCAIDKAAGYGFQPIAGGVADGYVVLSRKADMTQADAGKEVATRLLTLGLKGSDHTDDDRLRVIGVKGTLRITASSISKGGTERKPTTSGKAAAEQVLAACRLPAHTP